MNSKKNKYLRLLKEAQENDKAWSTRKEYQKEYILEVLEKIDELLPSINIGEELVLQYIRNIQDSLDIIISKETALKMLKLYPEITIEVIRFNTILRDTSIKESLSSKFCELIMNMPPPSYGVGLSDDETELFFKILQDCTKEFGLSS